MKVVQNRASKWGMKVTERGMVVDRKATVNQSTTRYKRSLNSNMKFISHRITKTGQQQIRKMPLLDLSPAEHLWYVVKEEIWINR